MDHRVVWRRTVNLAAAIKIYSNFTAAGGAEFN
jgi:hypothetical protein